ncbi:hypothetical protein CFAM422_010440 [Trichoderma lentiforme]|uniref:G domain-containing protein n=1 Tax=Trichoderma lentiforme TaxID=1567552 RepID=A0A9P4X8I2_9HYPO|nr:hypothetical protein CFAM422_010440 [Trichoderma lentiforme]
MSQRATVVTLPALGRNVRLGMLCDIRTGELYGGVSLWDDSDINGEMEIQSDKVQNAEYMYSTSLEESRKNASLDAEGSLALDLKLVQATGSAKYLNNERSSTYEARVDVSCSIVRYTRYIPQETLASIKYAKHLETSDYTHFVAEVDEGGSATLSFVQSCSSSEEAKAISGKLKATIMKMPISLKAEIKYSDEEKSQFNSTKISYHGAIAESVSNFDDACRVAAEMPPTLMKQKNALSYKLLPLSVLNDAGSREIRKLDSKLVVKTAATLDAGTLARLKLEELKQYELFQDSFPAIKSQVLNIYNVFVQAEIEMISAARQLLPELRNGKIAYNSKFKELQDAIRLFQQRTLFVEEFIKKKQKESSLIASTIQTFLKIGFVNYLGEPMIQPLGNIDPPRVLLSLGGSILNKSWHPLQKSIESTTILSTRKYGSDDSHDDYDDEDEDEDEDEDMEWFENPQTDAKVRRSCEILNKQRALAAKDVIFGIANIEKAIRPPRRKRGRTEFGDIILGYKGKLVVVTTLLPEAPTAPTLMLDGQKINVSWEHERSDTAEEILPTTGYIVHYRPRPNRDEDGTFPRATENELVSDVHTAPSETRVSIEKNDSGAFLFDDCEYEVTLSVETDIGISVSSSPVSIRTPVSVCTPVSIRTLRTPSVASQIIHFYKTNSKQLSIASPARKPWELDESAGLSTLFLGLKTRVERRCAEFPFEEKLAVKIVDVAPEYEPELLPSDIHDSNKTIVAVFTGTSGHGKSTEINAFISYLLGGEADDAARIMVIDDRGAKQEQSVTKYVTCYQVRPHSPRFGGKTFLIVDTPGYGDSRGIAGDKFVTVAMSMFFETVRHINAIILVCRAHETRIGPPSPVATYILSLFAKDVESCLRTIYTFTGPGEPLARGALQALQWPVENGEIEVNNAAFKIQLDAEHSYKDRHWWRLSDPAQFQVKHMLLGMAAIPTAASAGVTKNRRRLEQRCKLAEKKIPITAEKARIGAVLREVPKGKATTLCLDCNTTCHEICGLSDDNDKNRCIAIDDGACTICRKHCHGSRHKNARFIIDFEMHREQVVLKDLIQSWNQNTSTHEGVLLSAIETYLELQKELRDDIVVLAELTSKLMQTALLHDPTALITYIETLIQSARARGASPQQLNQLATAKGTLQLILKIKREGTKAKRESEIMIDVLSAIQEEMIRRMELDVDQRLEEEKKSCNLYKRLYAKLPR